MKYRLTSIFLLIYLMAQVLGSYANAFELINRSENPQSPTAVLLEYDSDAHAELMQVKHHTGVQKCSDCSDSTICLLGSCASLPSEWSDAISNWAFTLDQPVLAVILLQPSTENLYRPPIFPR